MRRQRIGEYTLIYTIGSMSYSVVEILWRGFTHWTMSITGGICFLLLYLMNARLRCSSLAVKCLTGSALITTVEFMVGCFVNLLLGWDVWDYSNMPFQLLGQVCFVFSALWFFLCIPGLMLASLLRRRLFRQE
ncbi:MAG: hypothetical protein RR135_05750 [Oscillospiraceae bacterium]